MGAGIGDERQAGAAIKVLYINGSPAMDDGASLVLFALDAAGLAQTTAFVTDGQLSAFASGG